MVAATSIPLMQQQHLHLDGVSWSFYERVLEEVGAQNSAAFPFLPIGQFEAFIHRMQAEVQTTVLREFQRWVASL